MDLRKEKEREHANRLQGSLYQGQEDVEKIAPNNKYYSIARKSDSFKKEWLLREIKPGMKVLDFCCGNGENALFLARHNISVIGIDISDISIQIARSKAEKEDVSSFTAFHVMDGEHMSFGDSEFDIIMCEGVLHHLDFEKAVQELHRVLKASGKIICNEPLAYNPLINLYRKLTPSLRTEWELEHLIKREHITILRKYFKTSRLFFFHLTTLCAVPFRNHRFFYKILSLCEKIDGIILKLPLVQWLSWQIVLTVQGKK